LLFKETSLTSWVSRGKPYLLNIWEFLSQDKVGKKSTWENMINKLQDRVKRWTYRALNFAGRLVLTKAVLQAIPTYLLSVFPTPAGILQRIRTIQRNFLWRGAEDKNKWALVAWEKLCWPKRKGGLGLQDPKTTNDAYGEKLWWRWVKESSTPWEAFWKAKYAPRRNPQDLIQFTGSGEGSTIWNMAWRNKSLIQEHCFWEIRNGQTTHFGRMLGNRNQDWKTRIEKLSSKIIQTGKVRVHQYWKQRERISKWRCWDPILPQDLNQNSPLVKELEEELQKKFCVQMMRTNFGGADEMEENLP
jgi:hypothetical protein